MNLSIVDYFGYNLSSQERLRLIKEAGFRSVMLLWAGYFDKDYKLFPEYASKIGLQIENAHAPYLHANDLWKDTLDGQAAFDELAVCIEECAAHGIQTVVMHPENKSGTKTVELPQDFSVGLDRMKRLVDRAERLDISISIENMSRPEYLEAIFKNIQSDKLGFCFDSGHWNVFTPKVDLLTLYGNKLKAVHLHDNDGIDDWHALPFSGSIDWNDIAAKLAGSSYPNVVALEIGNKNFETITDPLEFLRLAFERAKKIADCMKSTEGVKLK
ncbi:MAG: sugar phosphate isomerase/epimerase [Eubacteriaceae bacterium]|nr:sugar phosphate isomerase/epimerase [Eubacteriaceae bacterium]